MLKGPEEGIESAKFWLGHAWGSPMSREPQEDYFEATGPSSTESVWDFIRE